MQLSNQSNLNCFLLPQAKGYPDIATRSLLHHLSTCTSHSNVQETPTPILALTDFDPDGIAIMSTYKYGSLTLSHESPHLTAPTLQWLGIKCEDAFNIIRHQNDEADRQRDILEPERNLGLTARDRNKAIQMLRNGSAFQEDGTEPEWRRELQVMLMCNVKAEMEILDCAGREGIVEWVDRRLHEISNKKA